MRMKKVLIGIWINVDKRKTHLSSLIISKHVKLIVCTYVNIRNYGDRGGPREMGTC